MNRKKDGKGKRGKKGIVTIKTKEISRYFLMMFPFFGLTVTPELQGLC